MEIQLEVSKAFFTDFIQKNTGSFSRSAMISPTALFKGGSDAANNMMGLQFEVSCVITYVQADADTLLVEPWR